MTRFNLFLVLVFIFSINLSAQIYPPVKLNIDDPQKLDAAIERLMEEAGVPGLGLAVVKGYELVYHKGYGYRSMDTKEPVTDQTIFAAASLSKALFAYGVLKLKEAGKIDLDKPLYQYLEYEDLKHDERYKKVSARMVLSHSSGLPNWRNGQQLNFRYDPGQRFNYSGEGFVFLMRVVEKITGKSLEEFMQETVLQPLGMTNSSYVWQDRFDANAAIPHNDMNRTAPLQKPMEGNSAYSLQTTAVDYSKFIRALLNAKGLKKSTVDAMLTQQISATQEDEEEHGGVFWGLGIGLQETSDGPAFWHWGDNGTFKCFVLAYPKQKLGLVYFANSSNGLALGRKLMRLVLGGNYPSLRWQDYPEPDNATFGLAEKIMKNGLEIAMKPLMDKSGLHQDTSLINERDMNWLGYTLLNNSKIGAATEVFRMNTLAYPESANVYDSYGEALLRKGNLAQAALNYAKAANMDHDNETAKIIAYQIREGNKKGKQTFTLPAYANAKHVALAGSFNGWNMLPHPMTWENGQWVARLDLHPGEYQYKFVVDGVWIPDPNNKNVTDDVNHNSVIEIKN